MLPSDEIRKRKPFSKEWLILMALVIGMVYLFLPPPWQQNDESTQFEYVWLVAHRDHWPQPGDMDFQMRREVMASMIEHRFYGTGWQVPDLDQLEDPVDIGVSQLGSVPLYYFLASLPLRLFPNADVTQQLYLARLVSVSMFLFVVYCAIQTTNLLFGNHLLGWMICIFIALMPQLAYRMTAVNDDAAAIASMTFFVWMCVRGLTIGPYWKNILGIFAGMVLCFLSKSTAWLAVPFGILAILLSIFHTRQRLVWGGTLGLIFVTLMLAFEWQAALPAEFYTFRAVSRRVQMQQAVDGSYAFMTSAKQKIFYQVVDKAKLTEQTKTTNGMVTFGVWMWSNKPVEASSPTLEFPWQNKLSRVKVQLTEQPVFITAQAQIPEEYRAAVLRVISNDLPEGTEVYWDCLILVPGEQNTKAQPITRENCSQVEWDAYNGENLIRNASAERGWFPLREKAAAVVSKVYGFQITDFWAVFDPTTSRLYFQKAFEYLFRTFWGRFNWGTLPLVGRKPYRVFAVLSVLGVLGNGVAFWRYRSKVNRNLLAFFLLLFAADLIYTFVRFTGNWDMYYYLLPQDRYLFPVILPTAFLICTGWYALLETPLKVIHLQDRFSYIFIGLFLLYNSWAWYSIWAYWYG